MGFLFAVSGWILSVYLGFQFFKIRKQLNSLAESAAAWCDHRHD